MGRKGQNRFSVVVHHYDRFLAATVTKYDAVPWYVRSQPTRGVDLIVPVLSMVNALMRSHLH